jgi:hypothetical protein
MSHHGCMGRPGCQHEMMMKHGGPGMPDGCCGPGGMEKGMCPKGHGCMPGDSTMKCCPRHMMKYSQSPTNCLYRLNCLSLH